MTRNDEKPCKINALERLRTSGDNAEKAVSGIGNAEVTGPIPVSSFFIPASNEPSAVLARAFGECHEGQYPAACSGVLTLESKKGFSGRDAARSLSFCRY